jgi:hypothetical protein
MSTADDQTVSNLQLLQRVRSAAERGESVPHEDLPGLAESLERIFADDTALRAAISDEFGRPGERSPLNRARLKLRNQALRDCAKDFYSKRTVYDPWHEPRQVAQPVSYQAGMISRDLSEYFRQWLAERQNCRNLPRSWQSEVLFLDCTSRVTARDRV